MAKYLEEWTQNGWARKWELEITEEGTFLVTRNFFKNRIYRFYAHQHWLSEIWRQLFLQLQNSSNGLKQGF